MFYFTSITDTKRNLEERLYLLDSAGRMPKRAERDLVVYSKKNSPGWGETCLRKVLMSELRRYLVVLKTGVSPKKKKKLGTQNPTSFQTSWSYDRQCCEVIHNLFLDTICHFRLSSHLPTPTFSFFLLPLPPLAVCPKPSTPLSSSICLSAFPVS